MSDELPKGWFSAKLAEVVDPRKGKKPAILINNPTEGFVPYLDIHAIEKNIVRQFAEINSSKIAAKGDLFVVWDGARSGWVGGGITGAIGSTIMALTPRQVNSGYIRNFIASQFQYLNTNTRGTGIPHVDPEIFWNLEVPLAPLSEQHRIVEKLDKLMEIVNDCHKRLAKIPILLKRFRQSVIAAACSGRLTADWRKEDSESSEAPIGWKEGSVGEVIESLKYGTSQKCAPIKKGVPVLRIPNVANGSINLNDLKYAELPAKELNQLSLKEGDILLIRSNGSVSLVGKTALVGKQESGYAYAGYLIRLRPNLTIIQPEFLNLALSSYDIRLQIELDARSTSGVNNINSDEVRSLQILVPPLAEQKEIVRRIGDFFTLADQIEVRYKTAQGHVDKLTQSILAKAFHGELVPQDPNDEPASALLEKILDGRDNKNE